MQCLKKYLLQGWPELKDQIPQDMRPYWTIKDDMAVIDWGHHEMKVYSRVKGITATSTPTAA